MAEGDEIHDILPVGADELACCEPVYEEMPGWAGSTVGIKNFAKLPDAARNYLKRMEEVCEVPIDMISTGPDREETIVLTASFRVRTGRPADYDRLQQ